MSIKYSHFSKILNGKNKKRIVEINTDDLEKLLKNDFE